MVDLKALHNQIIDNCSKKALSDSRRPMPSHELIGVLGKAISDSVMKSDVRMYRREVFAFNGKYYESIDGDLFNKLLIDVMESLKLGFDFIVNHRKKVIDFCTDNLVAKDIKPQRNVIPFLNGLLNTATMTLMPHSPAHDILYCLNYEYIKDAKCARWMKFLKQILPEKGKIEVLQEYFGLMFLDREQLKLEQMLVLLGGGSNGKSVIFETIHGILGEQNVSTYGVSALIKGNSSDYYLAEIDGKIINYTSELNPKDFSSDITKKLISGEPIMARQIYSKPIKLKNIPLFICNANTLPQTDDKTHGFFRRLLIVPFDVTIEDKDQDKKLSVKLKDEYSGILNWIIEGRTRILKNNIQFTSVQEIDRVKEAYRQTQDSIYGFIKANTLAASGENTEKYSISDTEIYSNYVEYCKEVTKTPYGKKVFTDALVALKFKKFKHGDIRGINVYSDRNPELHWNKDIGNVYDEEDEEVFTEEKDQEEWKQVEVAF